MKKKILIVSVAVLTAAAVAVVVLSNQSDDADHPSSGRDESAQKRDLTAELGSDFELSVSGRYIFKVEYQDAHSGWVELYSVEDPAKDMIMEFEGRLCPIDKGGNFLVDMENDSVMDLSTDRWYDVQIDGYFEFSGNGRYLAVESPANMVRVYDTQSWEVLSKQSYIQHSGTIFINEDRHMITCHYPDEEFEGPQSADVYDTRTWTLVNTLRIDSWIEDLSNPDGTYVYDPMQDITVDVLTAS